MEQDDGKAPGGAVQGGEAPDGKAPGDGEVPDGKAQGSGRAGGPDVMAAGRGVCGDAPHTLSCRVALLVCPARDVTVVRLEILSGEPFPFSAGQYARVAFPGRPPRDFSIANQPGEAVLEFHIRDVAKKGPGSALAERLSIGDPVTVDGPFGVKWLREGHDGPILAIAGGTGLAGVKSIVETALLKGMGQDIHLYFGVRSQADLYFEDYFQRLCRAYPNLRFTPVLSAPEGTTARRTGLVSTAVAEDFKDFSGMKAYLAGPPAMVSATAQLLAAAGMDPSDIHTDTHVSFAE